MSKIRNVVAGVRTVSDIATLAGLPSSAGLSDIRAHVLTGTRYEHALDILHDPVIHRTDETWEVRASRAGLRVLVQFRHMGRGAWISDPGALPPEVLALAAHDPRRVDLISSKRPWSSWQSLRWAPSSVRQHQSKSGTLVVSLVVQQVSRPTGEVCSRIHIDHLDARTGDAGRKCVIPLPCPADRFLDQVRDFCGRHAASLFLGIEARPA